MDNSEVPFVSVVIPTFNMRDLLRNAVGSLYEQSYPKDRYEIIVVDNSSNDGTEEMMREFLQNSPCDLSYYRKENKGPGASRNLGIAKARGSIVAFTDSDCAADPDWLKNGVAMMADGVGFVQGKTLPNPGQPQRIMQHTMKVISENGFYQTCNIFYRKEALDQVGGFSPEFCGIDRFGRPRWGGEDTDLAWRMKENGWKSVFADDAVIYHHVFILTSLRAVIKYAHFDVIFIIANNVRKHPGLRDSIFYRKVFKSRQRLLFYLFVMALFLGSLVHWALYLLVVPYLTRLMRVSFQGRPLRSYHRGLALFFFIMLVEAVESALSLYASFIHRTLIL